MGRWRCELSIRWRGDRPRSTVGSSDRHYGSSCMVFARSSHVAEHLGHGGHDKELLVLFSM